MVTALNQEAQAMSSVARNDGAERETKATPSSDSASMQLIALSRILARQAAREAIVARNASPHDNKPENEPDGAA